MGKIHAMALFYTSIFPGMVMLLHEGTSAWAPLWRNLEISDVTKQGGKELLSGRSRITKGHVGKDSKQFRSCVNDVHVLAM